VAITERIEHYQFLRSLGIGRLDLSAVTAAQIRSLAQLAARYDVWALRRFAPAKRYALVTCFLVEIQKTLLDQVVVLHDQFLTAMLRKSRNSFERRYRELRQRAKKGWDTLLRAVEILLSLERPGADVLDELYRQIDKSKAAGMEWTEVLEIEEENERARIAAEILASDAYQTTMAKVRAFVQRGGGCRATYFRQAAK
jgi:hypothetical protein